ncbi:MAG: hypothetical protein E6Q32_03215 [Neisseriales bacterium]|nr:MAG: hypothetical protein E6Q32_03215 [Neisseriales bacterium]
MSELETISFKISKKVATDLKRKAGKNQSSFIRDAIKEKLSREIKEDETLTTMVDQIKNMDPLALHGALSDLVYTAQVIFKENKKQNEVLKLIYESAALGGTFAYETWKVGEDENYAENSKLGILQSVEDELIDMKFIERTVDE